MEICMFGRYSERARTTIVSARGKACRLGYAEMNPDHILLALLDDSAMFGRLLAAGSAGEMRDRLLALLDRQGQPLRGQDIPLHSDARKILGFAREEAEKLNSEHVENEHLLLGVLHVKKCSAARLLTERGLTIQSVRAEFSSPGERTRRRNWKALWRSLVARIGVGLGKEQVLIRRIARLVRGGKPRKALELLDDFMAEPVGDRISRIKNFAPQAYAIAFGMGELPLAKKYCEQALAHDPDSLLSLYGMADLSNLQGDHEQAQKYAVQCYELAVVRTDPLGKGFVELIQKRFPDLGPSLPVPDR
jgi:tetratricopeptide (TPR) repeat protein